MKTEPKAFEVPNYTQIPNRLFDELLPLMGAAELKVTLAICRKTFGWHKKRDRISISQLEKLTGLSHQGVITGLQQGMNRGTIVRQAASGGSYSYALVINGDGNTASQRNRLPGDTASQRSRLEVVNEVDTQKKQLKKPQSELDAPIGQAYACPDCGQICKSKGGLTNHRKAKHDVDGRHPALKAYQEKTNHHPTQFVRQLIIDAVGEEPADIAFWGEVVGAYVALGWNPRNVSVMLDYFKRREIPTTNGGNNAKQRHPQHGRASGGAAGKEAGSDAESDWFRQQREYLRKIPGSGVE